MGKDFQRGLDYCLQAIKIIKNSRQPNVRINQLINTITDISNHIVGPQIDNLNKKYTLEVFESLIGNLQREEVQSSDQVAFLIWSNNILQQTYTILGYSEKANNIKCSTNYKVQELLYQELQRNNPGLDFKAALEANSTDKMYERIEVVSELNNTLENGKHFITNF